MGAKPMFRLRTVVAVAVAAMLLAVSQAAHRPGSPQAALPQLRLPQRYEGETWVLLPLVNFRNYMWGLGGGIEGSRGRSLVAHCIGLFGAILAPCRRHASLDPIS